MLNILQDYYETKTALEILTKEVEEKKQAVIEYLKTQLDFKAETPLAKFSLRRDFEYEFTNKTMQKASQIEFDLLSHKEAIKEGQTFIKNLKAVEVEDGSAKLINTTYSPIMTAKKESKLKGGEKI